MLLGTGMLKQFYMFYVAVHTDDISKGNKVKNHACWIFSKCMFLNPKGTLQCFVNMFVDV